MFKTSKRNRLLGALGMTFILALTLSASPALAAKRKIKITNKKGDMNLRIGKIKTVEVAIDPSLMTDLRYANTPPRLYGFIEDLTGLDLALDQIINMGKKIWTLVEANRPVVNLNFDSANAFPLGVQDANDLEGWKTPFARAYRTTYENLYGVTVVDYTYQVMYTYGGTLNGFGRYIANAQIVPANLHVSWGYTFNASAKVQIVTNSGTKDNPVASMQLSQHWGLDTAISHEENTNTFYMTGAGEFKDLNP